jgi:hypothetical protein
MGVGAIFVSTLAVTRLKEPDGPPKNQEELLAATLQPIVSFVVLGSIIIRKGISFDLHRRQLIALRLQMASLSPSSLSAAGYTPVRCRSAKPLLLGRPTSRPTGC